MVSWRIDGQNWFVIKTLYSLSRNIISLGFKDSRYTSNSIWSIGILKQGIHPWLQSENLKKKGKLNSETSLWPSASVSITRATVTCGNTSDSNTVVEPPQLHFEYGKQNSATSLQMLQPEVPQGNKHANCGQHARCKQFKDSFCWCTLGKPLKFLLLLAVVSKLLCVCTHSDNLASESVFLKQNRTLSSQWMQNHFFYFLFTMFNDEVFFFPWAALVESGVLRRPRPVPSTIFGFDGKGACFFAKHICQTELIVDVI